MVRDCWASLGVCCGPLQATALVLSPHLPKAAQGLGTRCLDQRGLCNPCAEPIAPPSRSRRRRRGVTNAGIEQVVQIINLLAFVVCSAYVVDKDCAVLSYTVIWGGFVQ